MSLSEMTDAIRSWLPMIEFYMEDNNIPSDRKERDIYYRNARTYLADRLADLCVMVRTQERLERDSTASVRI